MPAAESTWDLVRDERVELADLVDGLTEPQWNTQSLCSAWRVRDVVAHLIDGASLTTGRALRTAARYGFRLERMRQEEAIKRGCAPAAELQTAFRNCVARRTAPPFSSATAVLTDTVVHTQDIRRPLGLVRTIPARRLAAALAFAAARRAPSLPGRERVAGLRLHATDLDWTHGDGPDVYGPGEALLMAMAGRPVALADLTGGGLDVLASRIVPRR